MSDEPPVLKIQAELLESTCTSMSTLAHTHTQYSTFQSHYFNHHWQEEGEGAEKRTEHIDKGKERREREREEVCDDIRCC